MIIETHILSFCILNLLSLIVPKIILFVLTSIIAIGIWNVQNFGLRDRLIMVLGILAPLIMKFQWNLIYLIILGGIQIWKFKNKEQIQLI